MLQIFTSNQCPACKQVKHFLDTKNIKYQERNIASKQNLEDAQSLGIRSCPSVLHEDGTVFVGSEQIASGIDKGAIA